MPTSTSTPMSITIELSPDELRHLESLATVRGVSPEQLLHNALAALGGDSKNRRLTPEQRRAAEELRPTRRGEQLNRVRPRKKRPAGWSRRALHP